MAWRPTLAVTLGVGVLWACGPPVIDTSSGPELFNSIRSVEEALEPDRCEAFRDAVGYLTDGAALAEGVGSVEPILTAFAPLDGLAADEITLMAWTRRVALLRDRIADLEARRFAGESAQAMIRHVEVGHVRLYPRIGHNLDRPLVEAEVRNRTSTTVFGIWFQVSLRRADEAEPWVVEVVHRPIGAGLAPGQTVSLRFELEDEDWLRAAETVPGDVLLCGVVRLAGRRGRVLAATDYGPTDAYLQQLWQARLDELLADRPRGAPAES